MQWHGGRYGHRHAFVTRNLCNLRGRLRQRFSFPGRNHACDGFGHLLTTASEQQLPITDGGAVISKQPQMHARGSIGPGLDDIKGGQMIALRHRRSTRQQWPQVLHHFRCGRTIGRAVHVDRTCRKERHDQQHWWYT